MDERASRAPTRALNKKNLNKTTLSHSTQARHRCELARASTITGTNKKKLRGQEWQDESIPTDADDGESSTVGDDMPINGGGTTIPLDDIGDPCPIGSLRKLLGGRQGSLPAHRPGARVP